ncbi:hypothetical protein A2U01_0014310 [Trifolium medium]|uniref:Envelope-like protein n=1 Tax=Trifolium medium TaxID=97028 RepID=A0A392N0U4_9FABA|nr:hypothetical protein [Trifolium medium]
MKATYDEICMTLTNNQVRKWPGKIPSVKLTAKYARLNKIVVINWVPTSHTSEHYSEQHPDICTAADVPCKREADLSLDYRLFEGSHAADIAGPSGKKSALEAEVAEEGGMNGEGDTTATEHVQVEDSDESASI